MRFPGPLQRTFANCRSIIWLASWIVPAEQRKKWRSQLSSQAWHWCSFLAESGQLNRDKKLELARFCWSAFPSAFWLRFDRERFLKRLGRLRRSPAVCLGAIALALVIVLLTSGILTAARSFWSSAIPQPDRVCLINLSGKYWRIRSETLLNLAAAWKGSTRLDAVAPYSWGPAELAAPQRTVSVLSAEVAPDFFPMLQLGASVGRTFHPGDEQNCTGCVVLSDEIWRLQFHADLKAIGSEVRLDGRPRTIIGVLPANFHLLSPEIAVWSLLDSGSPQFSNLLERIGAVARRKPSASQRQIEAELVDLTQNAGYVFPASLLTVSSGQAETRLYLESYAIFLGLAVGCALLIVAGRSGAGLSRAPLKRRDRVRWWSFFIAKATLLLLTTGLLAWTIVRHAVVYLMGSVAPMTNGVALWAFLILSLAPLSWAIRDQQRRCRVCLKRLGTPVAIGVPGYVLLNWSGTEMVCVEGHGILYLPDSQANWLERDRWDNLDESWASLFNDT